ncbi:uncharacterized protein K02A2.6-like [Nylanderia fulva]|uniref:uncharacterized protein K02A2.6-like n=1 Tax=Nylanderia fulva TaxID=613905 RepID=UPI0010FB400E|nr:uncharacterized protein K02A2.6-like [Nylanderia fulva]
MVDAGILEKVETSRWATPIVPVLKKDGGIRICGDFSISVNPSLIVDEHPLPTLEELFASMSGGTIFSKIDLKQAYLQLQVEETDREILTLSTHKGLFKCNRLMYGVASAPAIWQRTIENILSGIPGVTVFLDDIRIAGKDLEQHLERLESVLKRLSEHNIRINIEKCAFLKDEISCCGCEAAFNKVKVEFGSDKVLVAFNPKLPLVLAVDASPYGVGAVLSHRYPDGTERVIQYASNSLTETQKKYAQIDKEAFAIVFEIKKFHQFLCGNRFTLLTDNKPLVQILNPKKGLPAYSALRMQHYAIFLQAFNFDIKYRKSIDHGNADGFSRLPILEKNDNNYDSIDVLQIENLETLPVTVKCIKMETGKDLFINKIRQALMKGQSLVPLGLDDGEFTLQDEIVFKRERVVIPESLRNKVLKELHAGHFGTVRMKQLSRNFCWWPKIDKDIEEIIQNCKACIMLSNNPNCKVKHHWEAASLPFERVHIDFAAEEFQDFLKNHGINHKRTAPYHPATNGLAERLVQTLKQTLRKLDVTNGNIKTNLQKFLFNYRLTPHPELNKSPAEAMYDDGRIWKRHINQMKKIGNQIVNYTSNLSDMDHNGPIETTKDFVTAENNEQTKHIP